MATPSRLGTQKNPPVKAGCFVVKNWFAKLVIRLSLVTA